MSSITRDEILELFRHLETGQSDQFFEQLAEDVQWTVMGSHPLAGTFHGKEDYLTNCLPRLTRILKEGGVTLQVEKIYVDSMTAVVELKSLLTAINGKPYHNFYCWIVTFSNDKKVIGIKAYLDSALLKQTIEENE